VEGNLSYSQEKAELVGLLKTVPPETYQVTKAIIRDQRARLGSLSARKEPKKPGYTTIGKVGRSTNPVMKKGIQHSPASGKEAENARRPPVWEKEEGERTVWREGKGEQPALKQGDEKSMQRQPPRI